MSFSGKTVLVTGGGSGLGAAVARGFAFASARVLVNDLTDAGQAVADEIGGVFLKGDLSTLEGAASLGDRVVGEFGGADVLVNNAGFQHVSPVEEFPDQLWARMIQVMLIAPFQLTKRLVPPMKERGWGRIVNISSLHGVVASPFKTAYISAKHGMMGLTKTVALEVAEHNITVNAICPAYVRTPLVENQIKAQAETHGISEDEVINRIMLEPAPIKRLVEPGEVAELALYLASDKARSITGSAQMIDLGWTAR